MAADQDDEARNEIAALKERFRAAKEAAASLEGLVGGPLPGPWTQDVGPSSSTDGAVASTSTWAVRAVSVLPTASTDQYSTVWSPSRGDERADVCVASPPSMR